MVARGEIGFLISALAASNGIFVAQNTNPDHADDDGGFASEIYIIVTWAILLCTVVGPLALGFLAKRVKQLQRQRVADDVGSAGGEDPLGVWGVEIERSP